MKKKGVSVFCRGLGETGNASRTGGGGEFKEKGSKMPSTENSGVRDGPSHKTRVG